jgi:hypothetical protein
MLVRLAILQILLLLREIAAVQVGILEVEAEVQTHLEVIVLAAMVAMAVQELLLLSQAHL